MNQSRPVLRIGLLVDQFPELSETFITSEAHALGQRGHQVHIESRGHARCPNLRAAAGLSVHYGDDDPRGRRLRGLAWLAIRHPLRLLADLAARRRWRREEPVSRVRELAPVAWRLTQFGVQHLHAHFAAGAALDAMRLSRLLGTPFSVATHGYDIFQRPSNLVEKHKYAAFAVTACEYSLRHVRGLVGAPHAERVHKVIVGVDGERFRRRKPHAAGGTVLAVGRLVEKKGLRYLVEAAALLADDPKFERVVILGDGPLRTELDALARSLDVEDRVQLLGARDPDKVREFLESVALVAVPCVVAADGDRDTMPVIAKEALAMEVPVVASDEVGLPEIVRPEWGRLVPPGDASALASALADILALAPERRAEMGRAGRRQVLTACSLARETERLAELMVEVQTPSAGCAT